jgi:hypothetical protein
MAAFGLNVEVLRAKSGALSISPLPRVAFSKVGAGDAVEHGDDSL